MEGFRLLPFVSLHHEQCSRKVGRCLGHPERVPPSVVRPGVSGATSSNTQLKNWV